MSELKVYSPDAQADLLDKEELQLLNAYWRATNYLTVAQIYLRENPLLREPLKIEHIKPRLLGHWGTSPGLNILYVHMNRIIRKTGLDVIFLVGPGHGGPAIVANVYLEGRWAEVYPKKQITPDDAGVRRLCRQFSAPGGIPSHCSPDVPGSIHEGGELGYVLTHAFGAVMDSPDLVVLAVVGDGEAETGPLEGSWKGITYINPVHDGAVLPVLHLNGHKISGPTVLGRESHANIEACLSGHGYEVLFVEGDDPARVHQQLAKTLEYALGRIKSIQTEARSAGKCTQRPRWPMIVMRTPKGWTGPNIVDGKQVAGTQRSHQVPLATVRENPDHLKMLEEWLRSYHPEELFTETGALRPELRALAPEGDKRMSAQPYTNGGLKPEALKMPDLTKFALKVEHPAKEKLVSSIAQLGALCAELYQLNPTSFRFFCPDESNSNKFQALFEKQKRAFMLPVRDSDEAIGPDGRVLEVLSEHNVNGWLEGYTLTGRHGLLATYEAFAMVFVSMTLQSIKWFEVVAGDDETGGLTWRKPLPSINILLTSTCWRNDHSPGFVDSVITKKGSVVRAYFPVDANSLLVTAAHCFDTQNRVNLIIQDKQVQQQYLSLDAAKEHCKAGISRWAWASNDAEGEEPDIIMASCGDIMTQEALAAVAFLRERVPDMRVRFVNILNLMKLYSRERHPHGMEEDKFNTIFTKSVHVVFAYHSYPSTLHQLIHSRSEPTRFHVRGYSENGTTTTPFQMVALNEVSRWHLVQLALKNAARKPANAQELTDECTQRLKAAKQYAEENMEDQPEIAQWKWPF